MFQDEHACMDAEGRATQEAKAEDKSKYYSKSYVHLQEIPCHRYYKP